MLRFKISSLEILRTKPDFDFGSMTRSLYVLFSFILGPKQVFVLSLLKVNLLQGNHTFPLVTHTISDCVQENRPAIVSVRNN